MSILVFVEHHGNDFEKGSLGVLSKAASLGDDVAAVLAGGGGTAALASEAGKFGAATVYVADDELLDPPLPQPRVDAEPSVRNVLCTDRNPRHRHQGQDPSDAPVCPRWIHILVS